MKRRFREDPFSTIVLYSVLIGLFFMAFAFRGMIFTMFVKPIGIVNPSLQQVTQTDSATQDAPSEGQGEEATTFKSSGSYTVKEGDTLSSIAAALKVEWKALAELNNIQPPYDLDPGTELKLP